MKIEELRMMNKVDIVSELLNNLTNTSDSFKDFISKDSLNLVVKNNMYTIWHGIKDIKTDLIATEILRTFLKILGEIKNKGLENKVDIIYGSVYINICEIGYIGAYVDLESSEVQVSFPELYFPNEYSNESLGTVGELSHNIWIHKHPIIREINNTMKHYVKFRGRESHNIIDDKDISTEYIESMKKLIRDYSMLEDIFLTVERYQDELSVKKSEECLDILLYEE